MLERRTFLPPPTLLWRLDLLRRILPDEAYGFIRFLIFLLVLCIATYVYVQPAQQMSAAQSRISELQQEHARLDRENADLVRQLAAQTDISRVEARSRALGYRPPEQRMYVNVEIPAPLTLATPQTSAETAQALPWWQEILDWATARVNPPAYAQARR
jgi:cell division protein FtsL